MKHRWLALSTLLVLGAVAGCSGEIEAGASTRDGKPYVPGSSGPGSSVNGPGSSGAGGSGAGVKPGTGPNGGPVGTDPADPRIAQRIWRLTPTQFNDEVKRLFGEGAPEVEIPESAAEAGLTNIADNGVVDLGNASIFADGVRAIAKWVVMQKGTASKCASTWGTDPCVDSFLAWCPAAAFRRPVAEAELAELRDLYDELRAGYDFDYAFGGIVRAILLSPDFLYRTELGDETDTMVLTGNEIANLLAFSITDKAPDAELLEAAEKEDLADPDVREAQARRLMAKSERSWQRFFWEWLQMATIDSQGQEVGLDPALVADMKQEYQTFVREVVVTARGTLRDVMSAPYTWATPELAELYGADHPGTGPAKIQLDPAQRGGLLTQGAWLVAHGKRGKDNVVRRGMNIYRQAMCHNDLVPPAGVDVQAELKKLVGADATVREVVEARGSAPACGGCHQKADPAGMAFESFASDGSWQTVGPDGNPVETDGEAVGLGKFANARELSAKLVDDMDFQTCFVRRFAHFLAGADLGSPAEVAWTQQAHERFVETDTSLEELLVSLVRHPAFIERRVEAKP